MSRDIVASPEIDGYADVDVFTKFEAESAKDDARGLMLLVRDRFDEYDQHFEKSFIHSQSSIDDRAISK